MAIQHHRTIFISDVHLGSKGAKAEELLEFLSQNTSDTLYLVGDIIDFWALQRKAYFPQSHQSVLREIMDRARNGTKVIYLPGNHDENIRDFSLPMDLGNILITNECTHEAADGRRYLVIHGDQFDQVVLYAKWLAWAGDIGYTLLLKSNGVVNHFRRMFGLGYWSLSAYVKGRVKSAVSFVGNYENAVVSAVRARGLNGVICGHIHTAAISQFGEIAYLNDGDWVESLTAIVEDQSGEMRLVVWDAEKETAYDLAA